MLRSLPRLRGPGGRGLRVAHLTTVDMSLALLLGRELEIDVENGLETFGVSAPGPYVEHVTRLGVTHVPIPSLTRSWAPGSDLRAARDLAVALRRLDLDVLHTHNPKTGILGRVLGRALRIPVVVNTCHGIWASSIERRLGRAAVLAVEGMAARFSHFELYQNAEDCNALARWTRDDRTRVVGNGVDLSRFRSDEESRARVRLELGVGPSEVLVGGVGRVVGEKGVHEFAAAARALGERARFVWVGPSDPDKLDGDIGQLDGVQWLPARSDMPAVYSALDVFVLPSFREGFSRSSMEAAACGLPMVLSDIRGCREIGEHGTHLLLVPPGDADALTSAVARLIGDPAYRAELGQRAQSRAMTAFDQTDVVAASFAAYAEVAARRRLGWQVAGGRR
jgi:glycosyltransferase involved in cell wall biosynthesis